MDTLTHAYGGYMSISVSGIYVFFFFFFATRVDESSDIHQFYSPKLKTVASRNWFPLYWLRLFLLNLLQSLILKRKEAPSYHYHAKTSHVSPKDESKLDQIGFCYRRFRSAILK